MMLENKAAIITGASRGIGSAAALLLAREGCPVIINYKESREAAHRLADVINSTGGRAVPFKADVSNRLEVDEMVHACISSFGKVDILVNNAGISKASLFTDISDREWEEMINVNLKGVFLCCQSVLKHMLQQKSGKIINISSIWGMVGGSCEAHYSAAKGGVIALTKALAKEMGPSGIHVNAIAPGITHTDMLCGLNDDEMGELRSNTPLMRFGTPDDIARCVLYLAGSDSDFVTGQVISPNGGFVV